MKFKVKNILLVSFLAIAGFFGVSSALINKQVNEQPVAEKAEATTNSVTLAGSFNGWSTTATPLTKNGGYWTIDQDLTAGQTFKYVVNGGTWVGWGNGISYPSGKFAQAASDGNIECKTSGKYRLKAIDGIDGYDDKTYGLVIEQLYTVTFNKNSGTGGTDSVSVVSGADMPSATAPTRTNYNFGGYYDGSGGTGTQYYTSSMASAKKWDKSADTTLYAKWTLKTYDIRYIHNDGSGAADTVESKTHGVSYTIKYPSDISFVSQPLNAFVKWSTNSTGTGTDYLPGATYSVNSGLNLNYIQAPATFQYRINDGEWITLENKGNVPSGYIAQFELDNQSFTAGDAISVRKYADTKYPEVFTSYASEENLNNGTILYSYTGSIYVKVNSAGAATVYVQGYSLRGISITRGGVDYKCPASRTDDTHWYCNNIILEPGDVIKGVYQGGTPYEIGLDSNIFGISTAGVVSYPGVFNLVLSGYTTAKMNWIEPTMVDDASAKLLAQKFNTALSTVCTSTVAGGATSQITSAFSTQSGYYSHVTDACQKILNGKTASSDADVLAMRTKYDYIVNKYGKTIAPDYLGRNPSAKAAIRDFSPLSLFGDSEDNLSTVIIIAASSVALLSVTALSILVIKKRKNKEE